jgi:hypothetical protein
MRDRHFPRVCGSCKAPMARQENGCWRCGAKWASEEVPRTALRVIAGGRLVRPAADAARADAGLDADRWLNDGGSVDSQAAAAALSAVAVRR